MRVSPHTAQAVDGVYDSFRSSEDFLTKLADKSDGAGPVDAVPVTPRLRRAYGSLFALIFHRRLPERSSINHQSEVSALSGRVTGPYPAGYGFPSPFRCRHSLALTSHTLWGVGPFLRPAYRPSRGGPHRAYHVQQEGDASGLGPSLPRELRVFAAGYLIRCPASILSSAGQEFLWLGSSLVGPDDTSRCRP